MLTIQNDALITTDKPQILVFPNKLDNELFESNECAQGRTLHQWLVENVPAYVVQAVPLFSATLNNQLFEQIQWPLYQLKGGDTLALTVEAKDPMTIVNVLFAQAAIVAVLDLFIEMPNTYNSTTPDGSSIYDANAQGNRPRLMGVIPELAGTHKIFPDHLNMPRREYIDNEQWVYLMLAVAVGDYEINTSDIKIGNTSVIQYSNDIDYQIFAPGADVSGHEAYRNIYTSGEVGGTAGTTGIELKGEIESIGNESGGVHEFIFGATLIISGKRIDGEFYQVDFPFNDGDRITVNGAPLPAIGDTNNGNYRVVTVNGTSATMQKVDLNGDDDLAWTIFSVQTANSTKIALTSGGGPGQYNGPFLSIPENETTNTLWLDFLLPQGLGELDDAGEFLTKSVDINIQYRDEDAQTWIDVPYNFSDATSDQLAQTLKINITGAPIRPVVQVKRVTPGEDNSRVYDKIEWVALKSELPSATSYADITTIAIKIRGTNTLANASENKINIVATRILPVYDNGVWSAPVPTTDIAPFFAHVIKDVGHGDGQIELGELERLHGIWNTRVDTFSAVFDNGSTLFNVLKRVLAPGYAVPTLDYGQIIPVRDELRTGFDYMYQPENMKKPLVRETKLFDPDEPDGIEVEYFSPITWKPETVLCLLGDELGIKPKKVRAFGVTNKTKAWQFGMRKRREIRYRRTKYNFTTEMDALNSSYLSYDALADDIPGYSQTGHVLGVKGRELALSEPLEWDDGTHFISLRKPDGTLSGPYICTASSLENNVLLTTDLDFTPDCSGRMEPALFQFGVANRWCLPALVTDVKPSGTDKVSVTAVNYDVRVYADDDNLPAN